MVSLATLQLERAALRDRAIYLYVRWNHSDRGWSNSVKDSESSLLQSGLSTKERIDHFELVGTAALNTFWQAHKQAERQKELFVDLSVSEMYTVLRVLASHIDMCSDANWD